jgi:hypothetical protein
MIRAAVAFAAILIAALLPQALVGLDRPFGVHEIGAGGYFGVYVRNWENLGFVATRGLPLIPQVVEDLADATPYTNHPPGLGWLFALTGRSEAGFRLPTLLGSALAGWLLWLLLVPRVGAARAAAGALALVTAPVLAFYCQANYEPLTCAAGLGLWLAAERRNRPALIVAAVLGLWIDWLFAFFVAALPLLLLRRPESFRRLLPAFIATAAAGVAILGWTLWARAHPGLAEGAGEAAESVVQRAVLERPAAAEFLAATAASLRGAFGLPLLLLGAAGWIALLARDWRLAAAALAVQGMTVVVFPHHVMTHSLFLAYLAIPLAAGVAALPLPPRAPPWLLLLVPLVAGVESARQLRLSATPFFRDFGRAASDAAGGAGPDGPFVATNNPYVHRCYVDTPRVLLHPVVRPPELEAGLRALGPQGARYLHLTFTGPLLDVIPYLQPLPELERWLAAFPRERVPQLETTIRMPPDGTSVRIVQAWLYRLR